jgi:hypothetical protein
LLLLLASSVRFGPVGWVSFSLLAAVKEIFHRKAFFISLFFLLDGEKENAHFIL